MSFISSIMSGVAGYWNPSLHESDEEIINRLAQHIPLNGANYDEIKTFIDELRKEMPALQRNSAHGEVPSIISQLKEVSKLHKKLLEEINELEKTIFETIPHTIQPRG